MADNREGQGGRPELSFWQIWNMCFGFFGVQIGFGLQNANVSRIFQTLGAEIDAIPILWVAAPLTGLLVQPIIGHMSDKTWGRLGRRRPYFFYGALATTLSLFIMPNSSFLWIAAGMLWIMDASINVTMEPFRAFVGDMLPDRQRTTGFAMQGVFIGAGAVFASALPWVLTEWFGVSNVAPDGGVPPTVRLAFYVGGACVLLAVMWTVFTTKEYSPAELEAFAAAERAIAEEAAAETRPEPRYALWGAAALAFGAVSTASVAMLGLEKELLVLTVGAIAFGLALLAARALRAGGRDGNAFSEILADLFAMPKQMKQLAVVQFFSWFALFSMWIYTTPGVTAYHFGSSDPSTAAYNDGANLVGLLFAVYNGVAVIAALLIPPLAARIGRKGAHAVNLLIGAAGYASFVLIRDPGLLWIGMVGVGFAWASILTLPYAILAGSLPPRKMGVYIGVFNFFIVLPQLLAASVLGVFVRRAFGGEAIYALALAALCLVAAALFTMLVDDPAGRRKAPGAPVLGRAPA